MSVCGVIGSLTVGGRVVGRVRCDLVTGHDVAQVRDPEWPTYVTARTPHAVTLTWGHDAGPDLDLFDPDESFDVTLDG